MNIRIRGSFPRSWSRNAWKRIKNVNSSSRLSNIWNFFGEIQIISCRNWWIWTKPGYITMTRKQSNNQWSGGIAAYSTPESSECKNPLLKFSPRFLEIKTASSLLIIFQRARLSTLNITHLRWCNWRIFWRKNATGSSPRGSCSCTIMLRLTGNLQPRRNWSTGVSNVLITHPILRIWPRRTAACSLDWKKQLKDRHFSSSHSCRGDLVGRTTFWTFFEWLAKVRTTGWEVYTASRRVCWINPEFGRCSLFPFWSG